MKTKRIFFDCIGYALVGFIVCSYVIGFYEIFSVVSPLDLLVSAFYSLFEFPASILTGFGIYYFFWLYMDGIGFVPTHTCFGSFILSILTWLTTFCFVYLLF